jgi:integrase
VDGRESGNSQADRESGARPDETQEGRRRRLGYPQKSQKFLSRRTIEIPKVAVEALRRHRLKQKDLRLAAGPSWKEQDYGFTSKVGTLLDSCNTLHRLHIILDEQNLPRIRFYDLRHKHASLLISEGVHAKKIAERLGQASIKLTMDTYGHLFDGSDEESAERASRSHSSR